MKKIAITFGLLIVALLALFQLAKFKIKEDNLSTEIIISVIAVLFFFIGIYFRKNQTNNNISNKGSDIDYQKIKELKLSRRELEVLKELVNGLSNKNIADILFISESTVKSHVSSLFDKLDVKSRSQVIIVSQRQKII